MAMCKQELTEKTLILGLIVCMCGGFSSMQVSADQGVVYTCCSLINAFDGEHCDCAKFSEFSEFDLHQDIWTVPEYLRHNQSQVFKLRLKPKANTAKYCDRINGTFGTPTYSDQDGLLHNSSNERDMYFPSFLAFFDNGTLIYKGKIYHPSSFCIDRLSDKEEYTVLDMAVKENYCEQTNEIRPPYNEKWINQLFAAVSGLSCLFTILNVIIYLSLRNYLNVSGWVEFAYFLALGVYSAFTVPAFLYETTSQDKVCYAISVMLQFSEIMSSSSYFLIAFDAYFMLRKSDSFASYGEEIELDESKMRLVVYYLLLLAVPVGVSTYGVVLNLEGGQPVYGRKSCFSPSWDVAEYILFGTESATLLLILLSTNYIFARLSASTDVDDAPRVSLLSNMFFFTLSYWIMDLLKFARPLLLNEVSQKQVHTSSNNNILWIWILLDGFSYAQGVLSFIVFIFNRKTLKAFRKKAGKDGTLRAIFRHACCGNGDRLDPATQYGGTPMSPLMKSTSMRRSNVRQSVLY